MKVQTVAAFVVGCFTSVLVGWMAPGLGAQGSNDSSDAIKACAGTDNVLRLIPLSAGCPDGQRTFLLRKKLLEGESPTPSEAKMPERTPLDTKRLDDFERRIREIETSTVRHLLGNRVVAPFEVVDRNGQRIFLITTEGGMPRAELYRSGKAVATMVAPESGGQFVAHGTGTNVSVYTGIFDQGNGAGLAILEAGVRRTELGRDPKTGRFRLKFFGGNGSFVAGIGEEATAGGGLAVVNDVEGKPRAAMGVNLEAKGYVTIANGESELATLMEGSNYGGLLVIRNSEGHPMVEAGVTEDGVGVVRAGPEGFKPGMGVLGLPSSYIIGKK